MSSTSTWLAQLVVECKSNFTHLRIAAKWTTRAFLGLANLGLGALVFCKGHCMFHRRRDGGYPDALKVVHLEGSAFPTVALGDSLGFFICSPRQR